MLVLKVMDSRKHLNPGLTGQLVTLSLANKTYAIAKYFSVVKDEYTYYP